MTEAVEQTAVDNTPQVVIHEVPASPVEVVVPAQEYLESTVMSVLTQGLEDVCRVRPANPIDYLALYLLRRSDSSNVIEVPYADAVPQVQAVSPDDQ